MMTLFPYRAKSITPPRVKESYFATCDRDDEGHCLPKGEAGAEKPEDQGKIKRKAEDEIEKLTDIFPPEDSETPEEYAERAASIIGARFQNDPEFKDSLDQLKTKVAELAKEYAETQSKPKNTKPKKTERKPKVEIDEEESAKSELQNTDFTSRKMEYSSREAFKPSEKMISYGKEVASRMKPALRLAARSYTDSYYEELNAAMRECPPKFECLSDKEKEMLDLVEAAIKEAGELPEPVDVYRGLCCDEREIKKLVEGYKKAKEAGKPIRMPSITSTSLSPALAFAFAAKQNEISLTYKIKAKTGLYAEGFTRHSGEYEVIQSSKTRYRILDVADVETETSDGSNKSLRTFVFLEEV